MVETVDIAVVGGGVMGLSAAWRSARAGRQVVLFERTTPGNEAGSSHGATRIFRFAYDDPLYVGMAKASLPLWRELEGGSQEILQITGGLDLGDDATLARCRAAMDTGGAGYETLPSDELRGRFPWLDAPKGEGLYSPDTGVLFAADACTALAAACRAVGADVREHTTVRSLNVDDESVVLETEGGNVRARRVVLAAGAWTGPLARTLGMTIPLRVTREQVFYYEAPGDVVPVIFRTEVLRYVVPGLGASRGVKVGEHGTGGETTADDRTFDIDSAGRARIDTFVAETFTGFGARIEEETCLYTNTPDDDFVVNTRGPLVIVSPCSGHGFKFAPLIGEIAACLATGREPPADISRFSAARFS